MNSTKRQTRTGDEIDVVSKTRREHGYLLRPGVSSSIKRKMRRRERHEARRSLSKED